MRKFLRENYLVWIISLISWIFLSYILYYYQLNTQGADTTFAAQILYNFKHSLVMNTSMGISIVESMDHIWSLPAQQVCSLPLDSRLTSLPWFHYYFVIYLLAPFARAMDIPVLIAVSTAGIYLSVLIFTYLFGRKKNLSVLNALLLTLLVSQHPLWSYGVYGQYYFNRFFLPFSALFIWLLDKKKISYPWLIIVGLLAVSSNEIYGVALSVILVSYLWINQVVNKKLLVLSGIFFAYSAASMYLIHHNLGLVSNQIGFIDKVIRDGVGGTMVNLYHDFISLPTQIFLIVNIIFGGIFSLINRATIIPFILILIPNLLINIGGAQMTGWSTHYHMSYFIPLVWLSISGLSSWTGYRRAQTFCLGILILLSFYLNPYTLDKYSSAFIAVKNLYHQYRNVNTQANIDLSFRSSLRSAVGDGQTASLPEAISYHLYDHDIYYYPHMLETVDNIIFRYDKDKIGESRFSSINYGHQDPSLDFCIIERMKAQQFDFSSSIIVGDWAVIKRQVISSEMK